MQDIMVEKAVKDSIHMKVKIILLSIVSVIVFGSCGQNNANISNIPNVPVNLTLNLDLPQYQDLSFIGQYVYENGGNKGIVVIHHTDGKYYAIERTCSYKPFEPCNNIEVNPEMTRLKCGTTRGGNFEPCCGSQFFMNGQVLQGPATFPLKNYRVQKSGSYLNISN